MKADMFGMFIETLCVEICDAHLECTYWNSRGGGGIVIVDLRFTFEKYPTFKSCHRHTFHHTRKLSFQNMTLARQLIN